MKLSKINIFIGVLILIIIVLLFKEGCNRKEVSDLKDQVGLEKAAKDSLKYSLNKKSGEWEYSKQTFVAANGQLTDFLATQDAELAQLKKAKKASVGIVTKTETRIDTIVLNLPSENIAGVDPSVSDSIRKASIVNPYYRADITSWPKRTSLALIAWDSVKYSIGPDYRLVARHSNPYVKVNELNSFYVKPDVKKRNWKYWLGAIAGGAIVYGITR